MIAVRDFHVVFVAERVEHSPHDKRKQDEPDNQQDSTKPFAHSTCNEMMTSRDISNLDINRLFPRVIRRGADVPRERAPAESDCGRHLDLISQNAIVMDADEAALIGVGQDWTGRLSDPNPDKSDGRIAMQQLLPQDRGAVFWGLMYSIETCFKGSPFAGRCGLGMRFPHPPVIHRAYFTWVHKPH